jgi:aerobic C4-dicarboxylate transport protein
VKPGKPLHKNLAFQMVVAIVLGAVVGYVFPQFGAALNPVAGGFVKLITMVVGLVIFLTVTTGIAKLGDFAKVGKIGVTSLIYFEVASTIALVWGLVMVEVFKPGVGMNIDPSKISAGAVAAYASSAKSLTVTGFILNIIPKSAVGAFGGGTILQVLVVSLFVGFALLKMGERGAPIVDQLLRWTDVIFIIVGAIMKVAPIAVFAATGYTIGKFGLGTLVSLGKLVGVLYLACILFIVVGMGLVARFSGFSLWKMIKYIREEILLAFSTGASEAVLPRMLIKLENAGCSAPVVGFVVPTGYLFNLDGSSLYLTLAAVFIAQACNIHLSLGQDAALLGMFLLTSKGVGGVTAGGFVTLAGTLSIIPDIPVAGLALVLGVDRFMDAMRTSTNVIGNAVATLAIAKWEGQRDDARMHRALDGQIGAEEMAAAVGAAGVAD